MPSRVQAVIVRVLRRYFVRAHAEVVDDLDAKRALVTAHPFFVPLPVVPLNLIHMTVLRPLTIAFLRWWVGRRPVVLIRPVDDVA